MNCRSLTGKTVLVRSYGREIIAVVDRTEIQAQHMRLLSGRRLMSWRSLHHLRGLYSYEGESRIALDGAIIRVYS